MPTYNTTTGDDTITGSVDDDLFIASIGDDILDGNDGVDTLDFSGLSSNIIRMKFVGGFLEFTHAGGTTQSDNFEVIIATDFNDSLFLGSTTFAQDMTYYLGAGRDTVLAGLGNDTIYGEAGNDTIYGNDGVDYVDGGSGFDKLSFYHFSLSTQGVIVDLRNGTVSNDGFGNSETFTNIEGIDLGTVYVDQYDGDDGNNIFNSLSFGNIINGHGGNDIIRADAAGHFDGGDGIDTLDLKSTFTIIEDQGNDGTWDFFTATSNIEINLATGQIINDGFGHTGTIANIENLEIEMDRGSPFRITLTGSDEANEISIARTTAAVTVDGGAGNDNLITSDGDDFLTGGSGDDTLTAGFGDDSLNGGAGRDRLEGGSGDDILQGGADTDFMLGGTGRDRMFGGDQSDRLFGGDGNDIMLGQGSNDIMFGGGNNDVMYGGLGNDTMNGGSNVDRLYGGENKDTLFGGNAPDLIDGGAGNDTLWGGTGNGFDGSKDTFVFDDDFGSDTIKDFEDGTDLIDFSDHSDFNSFADVLANASDDGTNLTILLDSNNTILIENFTLAELDASDFVF